jgi:condensin complex subunit 2
LPDLALLDNKAISHSLAGFSFSKDSFAFDEATFFQPDTRSNDDDDIDPFAGADNEDFGMDVDGGGPPVEDFFQGDQGVGDNYGAGPDDFGADNASNESVGGEGDQGQGGGRPGAFVPFDPRRVPNERDLVMAMTDGDGDGGMMDYFDQNFLKNWAGPEHWKLRKVIRKRECLLTDFLL